MKNKFAFIVAARIALAGVLETGCSTTGNPAQSTAQQAALIRSLAGIGASAEIEREPDTRQYFQAADSALLAYDSGTPVSTTELTGLLQNLNVKGVSINSPVVTLALSDALNLINTSLPSSLSTNAASILPYSTALQLGLQDALTAAAPATAP